MSNESFTENLIKKIRASKEKNKEEPIDYFNMENHIENGYIIDGLEKIKLETKQVIPNTLEMTFPTNLDIMDEALANIKYEKEFKPDYPYTSENLSINFNFSIEYGKIDNSEIEELRDILLKQMECVHIGSEFNKYTLKTDDKTIGVIEFETYGIGEVVYNKLWFLAISTGLVVITFTCEAYSKDAWASTVDEMVMSIKEI